VLVIATLNTSVLAPVSARTRKWAAVTRVNTSRAMALPIDAIELKSNPAARTIAAAAVTSSPAGARPPNLRPSAGGNWPIDAICSHRPAAGYSPAFVAPVVENSAVTLMSQ
jgi:hypothetical protein